jgi:hypothetical protein
METILKIDGCHFMPIEQKMVKRRMDRKNERVIMNDGCKEKFPFV